MLLTTAQLTTIDRWKAACQDKGWGLQIKIIRGEFQAAHVSKPGKDVAELPSWVMEDVVKDMPKPNGSSNG
jgi:hypothetical protein